jgi:hypothetical protein
MAASSIVPSSGPHLPRRAAPPLERAVQTVSRLQRRVLSRQPPAGPSDPKWNVPGYALDCACDPGNNGNIQDPGAGRTDTQIVWRGHIVRTENGKRPRSIGARRA